MLNLKPLKAYFHTNGPRFLRLLFTDRNSGESPAPLHLGAALASGELSDDDNSSNGDSFHAQTSVGSEPTVAPQDVDRDGEDDEDARNAWRPHGAERNRCASLQIATTSNSWQKLSDRQTDVAHLSSSFPSLGLNSRPGDWVWCPELDHRAVVQFKTLMRKKGLSTTQQPCCRIDAAAPPSSCETPLQDCGGGHSVSTVALRRRADESFGINVEMTSHPLKVVITRLNPGGAAGRVRVHFLANKPLNRCSFIQFCLVFSFIQITLN